MRWNLLNRKTATNFNIDHKFAPKMSPIAKNLLNWIIYVTFVKKRLFHMLQFQRTNKPSSKHYFLIHENITSNNHLSQPLKKCLRTFPGTTKIHLTHEFQISTPLIKCKIIDANLIPFMEVTFNEKLPFLMAKMTAKKQNRRIFLKLGLPRLPDWTLLWWS